MTKKPKKIPFAVNRDGSRSLLDQVTDGLREAIVRGYYAPGDVLPSSMYSFQTWRDTARSTLALDLVPCERNGVAGFWDKVESRFLGRTGSGVLETVGDEIVNPDATVLSRSSTLPLPPPSAFVITVR